jgi:hypothetical protein
MKLTILLLDDNVDMRVMITHAYKYEQLISFFQSYEVSAVA